MQVYLPKDYASGSSFVLDQWNGSSQATTNTDLEEKVTALRNELLDGVTTENLNSIKELSAALDGDANYASTITTALSLKAPKISPQFTGNVT